MKEMKLATLSQYLAAKDERGVDETDKPSTSRKSSSTRSNVTSKSTTNRSQCSLCNEYHSLHKCPVFLSYEVSRQLKYVKERKGCTNCLNSSHTCSNCPSTYTCHHCKQKHHSLLHKDDTDKSARSATDLLSVTEPSVNKSLTETVKSEPLVITFLHTALVKAVNEPRECQARIALNTGDSSSLITEALASQLHLKRHP